MSPAVLFLFLVQPFALALAADHLLARRRPAAIAPALLYAGGAVLACGLVGAPLGWVVRVVGGGEVGLGVLVAVSVAVLTYAFLTGVWLARIGAQAMSVLRR